MKLANDIFCLKVTHLGRVRAAEDGTAYGSSVEGVRAAGGWSQPGSLHACYTRDLPPDALLAMSHFNGQRQDSYFLPRSKLGGEISLSPTST